MSTLSAAAPRGIVKSERRQLRRRIVNGIMLGATGFFTLLALIPLVWIIVYVFIQGASYVNLALFTELPRALGQSGGGVSNAIQGTIVITILAILFSVPVGLMAGIYAANNPNTTLGLALRFSTDVLSGVPSIIIGLFGYAAIVVPQGHYSGLAAGVAVSIIMIPTIIRTTEEMLKLVPGNLREGSLALGSPEWKTSLRVLVPAAVVGIATGFMLAVARGVGETAPLLFTALGNDRYDISRIVQSGIQQGQSVGQITQRIIGQPIDSLTLTMYQYSQSPFPERVHQAWAVALVLMLFVLGVNILTRWITRRSRNQSQR